MNFNILNYNTSRVYELPDSPVEFSIYFETLRLEILLYKSSNEEFFIEMYSLEDDSLMFFEWPGDDWDFLNFKMMIKHHSDEQIILDKFLRFASKKSKYILEEKYNLR